MDGQVALQPIEDNQTAEHGQHADHLLHLQRDILEMVARNAEYKAALDALCRATESLLPNSVASIMLFDPTHTFLEVKSAPSIPNDAVEFLNGLTPGPEAGNCGTAVFTNEPVFVKDPQADPRWKNMRKFSSDFNICSCWSMPIRAQKDEAIGSLTLSSFEGREPTPFHKRLLETAAHLACIIIEREKEKDQLWKMAHHDNLTDLPNRVLFNLHVERAIQKAQRGGRKFALLFLDLDRFKDINDTLGHQTGDEVLKLAAHTIQKCLRKGDLFARLGGDEFGLLLDDSVDAIDAQHVAEKIIEAFDAPLELHGEGHHLSTSIGISMFPEDATDLLSLQKHADLAMYAAKSEGRGRVVHYRSRLAEALNSRVAMAKNLRSAIRNNELFLHYQPQFDTKTGSIVAIEALLRWQRPDKTMIPPVEFISIAEETGLIVDIGDFVARSACRQCVQWWELGLPKFTLAINLSVKQLQRGYADKLKTIVDEMRFPLNQLEVEITESLIIRKGSEVMDELRKLEEFGVSIAMDDFGTGQSSLAQLKHLPISKLKIDSSFVRDISENTDDRAIARTIIAMGHTLGLKVVAEGVETTVQQDFLREENCDQLQGYLLARPLPAEELKNLLSEQQPTVH